MERNDLDYEKEYHKLLKEFNQLQRENNLLKRIIGGLGLIIGGSVDADNTKWTF